MRFNKNLMSNCICAFCVIVPLYVVVNGNPAPDPQGHHDRPAVKLLLNCALSEKNKKIAEGNRLIDLLSGFEVLQPYDVGGPLRKVTDLKLGQSCFGNGHSSQVESESQKSFKAKIYHGKTVDLQSIVLYPSDEKSEPESDYTINPSYNAGFYGGGQPHIGRQFDFQGSVSELSESMDFSI